MALCSRSSNAIMDSYTVLDNVFLNEFLPQATGDDVKVYLYGYALCNNPNIEDNSIDTISKVLSLTEDQILKSFSYWQEMGLVQITSVNPLEVKYLPVRNNSGGLKIRNKSKYKDFNKQMQAIITGRMLTPNELNEYYYLIETYHFEPEAILLIASYCKKIKSDSIGYPYILAVARSFANDGLKTSESVEQKMLEQELKTKEIKQLLEALGLKRDSDIEEKNLYLKWINTFGFTHGVVIEVAKSLKKRGGFNKLDEVLTKYHEQKLLSMEEISSFSAEVDAMYETARQVTKTLGLSYQNLDNVVNTYINDWTNKGYSRETLVYISNYCFKQSVRTVASMDNTIQKMYKLGLVSLASIQQYIASILAIDENIKEVIDSLGLVRLVSSYDRDFYKTWTNNWGFTHEQILLVAKSANGKSSPMPYMNKILADMFDNKITSTKEIEKRLSSINASSAIGKNNKSNNFVEREYSKEELSAVFDSLDDVEI